ncbi:MAG: NADH-quinone oxidoreductase subunit NuoH [Acidimicrobiia bacterium]|nr:NADH-quinone oxidoreductase subunit NuoH [Acidimicrobiia bacterium]MXX45956.1 NADH-quinone oxidoreductase subunit NuoH [Acidimicrobiia bacterium]MXY75398.1 NADH-quinone oxidoreductase subunit NuoH [Acidimicrobiia bacterium]MYB79563.1 NADH-quinone oxidoreductase subunit NuoH [Acidimicrobiia bacterium]MYD41561.1 NADH-quinone oxidoreductase subunit NuoH [Acidimicrobiia bacterium]
MGMAIGYAEMKISAHMQSRIGPYFAGGRFGWAQLIADGVKFFQKEDLVPDNADRPVFKMAPVLVMVGTVGLFVVIPFGPGLTPQNLDLGIFYALAISSIGTIGVLMAGWSSGNKYSLMGGLRAAGQLIAYELPLVLAVVGVVILAGTMSLDGIVQAQISWFSEAGWSLGMPFVIVQAVGLGVFFVASLAELSRIPFDMPIAESELVMGYLTEYSGFRFLFFFLAEFANMFTLSAIAATLFLGGYWVPGVPDSILQFVGPLVLLGKIALFVFVSIWFRWTFPRFREDQLQTLAWKWLVPISLANIIVTGVLKVVL